MRREESTRIRPCDVRHGLKTMMRSFLKRGTRLFIGVGFLLGAASGVFLTPARLCQAQNDAPVLIANADFPDHVLSPTEIQNIFLGKMTKVEGEKITFVILQSGDVHAEFLDAYLSRTPSQYARYWKKLVFSGKGKSPKAFGSEEDLVAYIAQTPGALGYIDAATAETLDQDTILLLTVQ